MLSLLSVLAIANGNSTMTPCVCCASVLAILGKQTSVAKHGIKSSAWGLFALIFQGSRPGRNVIPSIPSTDTSKFEMTKNPPTQMGLSDGFTPETG